MGTSARGAAAIGPLALGSTRVRGRRAGRAWLPALAAVALATAPACLCPPKAEDLLATGFRTPRQTLRSFQTFLRADLPMQEYLCFSAGFRRRNGLSAATYAEAREQLFASQPWIRLVAKAEVAGERAGGEDEHWIDARVLGRTVRVKLVREAFFEIFAADRRLEDDFAEFERLVDVRPRGDGAVLTARIALESTEGELALLSEVHVARHWKIDDLAELEAGAEPLPAPAGPHAPPT